MLFLDSWVSMALGLYQEVEKGGKGSYGIAKLIIFKGFWELWTGAG